MRIACTLKVIDKWRLKPQKTTNEPFHSWHANLIKVNHRQSLLLMNDETKYCALIYNVARVRAGALGDKIVEAIKRAFLAEGYRSEIADRYFELAGELVFSRTQSRSVLTTMNTAAQIASSLEFAFDPDEMHQTNFSLDLSREYVTQPDGYLLGKDVLFHAMKQAIGTKDITLLKAKPFWTAHQIEISLFWENKTITRQLIVPAHINFEQLHFVIQGAFGWLGYNEYAFLVLNEGKVISLITSEDIPIRDPSPEGETYFHLLDYKTTVNEYLPLFEEIEYLYDFQHEWRHLIRFEKTLDAYYDDIPLCLSGKGTTPTDLSLTEDLKLGEDETDAPIRRQLYDKMASFRTFDLDAINLRLKDVLDYSRRYV